MFSIKTVIRKNKNPLLHLCNNLHLKTHSFIGTTVICEYDQAIYRRKTTPHRKTAGGLRKEKHITSLAISNG